jgi:hypothetical protein
MSARSRAKSFPRESLIRGRALIDREFIFNSLYAVAVLGQGDRVINIILRSQLAGERDDPMGRSHRDYTVICDPIIENGSFHFSDKESIFGAVRR